MSKDPLIEDQELQTGIRHRIEDCFENKEVLKLEKNFILNLNQNEDARKSLQDAITQHRKREEEKELQKDAHTKIPLPIKCIFYGLTGIFSPFWIPNKVKNKCWVYFFRFYSLLIIASAILQVTLQNEIAQYVSLALYVLVFARLIFRRKNENTVLFATEFSLLAVSSNSRLITAVMQLKDEQYYLIIQYAVATILFNVMLGYMINRTIFKDESDVYLQRKNDSAAEHIQLDLLKQQCNPDTFKVKILQSGIWTEKMLQPWLISHCSSGIPQYRGEWLSCQVVENEPIAAFKFLEQKISLYMIIQVMLTIGLCFIFDTFFSPYNDMAFPCVFLIYESVDIKSKIQSFKIMNNTIRYHRGGIEDYALLNIFDPVTLHSWNFSRKIFQKYRSITTDIIDTITITIFITSIFYIFVELLHFFTAELGQENPQRSATSIIVATVVLSLVLRRMYFGGILNGLYDCIHREIKLIKKTVSTFKAFHKAYWQKEIVPKDNLHKDLFLETGSGHNQKCVERHQSYEKVKSLLCSLEDLEDDIEKDNEKHSYKFLNIFYASPERFWELITGIIISITMIAVNYIWSEITGKESIFG